MFNNKTNGNSTSDFMNKTIIVTGGSRGIGAATALKAASEGYSVCVNYLHNSLAANNVVTKIQDMVAQLSLLLLMLVKKEMWKNYLKR